MTEYDFDVAVTFAGEDRAFVDEVVTLIKGAGLTGPQILGPAL